VKAFWTDRDDDAENKESEVRIKNDDVKNDDDSVKIENKNSNKV